jgi:hypothetical protein
MKKLIILSLLIVAGQVAAWGQTVNIHMKDGSVIEYDASGVDYVNFTDIKHEAVDLGLTSGTKWATCNIGATKPEETGNFIAWGEMAKKDDYSWATYKWCNGSKTSLTKYTSISTLEPEDDAAHVLWGGTWRMPTVAEVKELITECSKSVVTQNGVKGAVFTGPNGNSIFFPASGCKSYENDWEGEHGLYWLNSTQNNNWNGDPAADYFEADCKTVRYVTYRAPRCWGLTIRPVTN